MKNFESNILTLGDMEELELIFRLNRLGANIDNALIYKALIQQEDENNQAELMEDALKFLNYLDIKYK